MHKKKKIVTHSGKYHADDLFAVATIQLLLGVDNVEIVRSRDQADFDDGDYVVDVGGVYDPQKQKFDHHRQEGAGQRENGIPYAAFGLVWKEYGEQLAEGEREAKRVEEKLVQPIDAADNGHSLFNLTELGVPPYTIQTMLQSFLIYTKEDITFDKAFMESLPLVRKILSREIELAKYYVLAEDDIKRVYQESEDKEVIVFPEDKEYNRELIGGILCQYPEPMFAVLYRPDNDSWQTAAIKKEPFTFENRKRFPKEWGGSKTTKELEELTGFEDVIFIHRAGFMAISKSKETAVALAKKVLAE